MGQNKAQFDVNGRSFTGTRAPCQQARTVTLIFNELARQDTRTR